MKTLKTTTPKLHSIKFKSGPYAENVVYPEQFPTAERIPVSNVLHGAILAGLRDVVIMGYQQDGKEYIASSISNPKEASYMFGRGQLQCLREGDYD